PGTTGGTRAVCSAGRSGVELGEPAAELGDGLLAGGQGGALLVLLVLPDGDVLLNLAGHRVDERLGDLRRLLVAIGVLDREEEREMGGLVVDRCAAPDQRCVEQAAVAGDREPGAAAEDVDASVDRASG